MHALRRPPTSDLRPPTSDLRPPTSGLRPPASDLRPRSVFSRILKSLDFTLAGGNAQRLIDKSTKPGHDPVHMKAITYTAARENLATTMNQVCDDHDPVIITRNREQAVVMLSLADYESLQETAYLMRSPANARRLLESIQELTKGEGLVKPLAFLTA